MRRPRFFFTQRIVISFLDVEYERMQPVPPRDKSSENGFDGTPFLRSLRIMNMGSHRRMEDRLNGKAPDAKLCKDYTTRSGGS